jgi:hypothetical protein
MAKVTVESNMVLFVPAKGKAIMCRKVNKKLITKTGKEVYAYPADEGTNG